MMAATPPFQSSTVAARTRRATNQVNAHQRRTRTVQSSSCTEVSFFSSPICIVHGLQPKLIVPSRCCCILAQTSHFDSSQLLLQRSVELLFPFSPGEQAYVGEGADLSRIFVPCGDVFGVDTAGINFDLSPFVRKQMSLARPMERRSKRLRGDELEFAGLRGAPVHLGCGGSCPRCDAAQSENEEVEECTLCRSDLMGDDRFVVPCCHQALHLDCLVRSFNSCGVRCPFCQVELSELARSSQFQQVLGQPNQFDQPIPDPTHQPVVPPPPLIWPLCCRRLGTPPDFALLEDRRMEWSPIQPDASGSSASWTFQWLCLKCSRTFSVDDVPPLAEATECWSSPGM